MEHKTFYFLYSHVYILLKYNNEKVVIQKFLIIDNPAPFLMPESQELPVYKT